MFQVVNSILVYSVYSDEDMPILCQNSNSILAKIFLDPINIPGSNGQHAGRHARHLEYLPKTIPRIKLTKPKQGTTNPDKLQNVLYGLD